MVLEPLKENVLSLSLSLSPRLMADGTQGCDAYEERMEKLESLSLSLLPVAIPSRRPISFSQRYRYTHSSLATPACLPASLPLCLSASFLSLLSSPRNIASHACAGRGRTLRENIRIDELFVTLVGYWWRDHDL